MPLLLWTLCHCGVTDMERFRFVENGSLSVLLGKLSKRGTVEEQLVAVYTTQILEGLRYLHEQGVIHRDIKGANILLTKVSARQGIPSCV